MKIAAIQICAEKLDQLSEPLNERGMSMQTKHFLARGLAWMMVLALALPPGVIAQEAQANVVFKPEELEQILAPIALHPDTLVAQILMASTYPLEVVQAERWAKQNASL